MNPRDVLVALLAHALGDEASANMAIALALRGARRKELPARRAELLAFVERHLHGELRKQLGETRSSALMDELSLRLDRHDDKRTSRPPAEDDQTTERPTVRAPEGEAPTLVPIPKQREPAHLADDDRVSRVSSRRSVLVIDRDRMARMDLARALIRADCEVTVRETCEGALSAADNYDVIVTEVDGVAIDELIEAFVDEPPSCAVLAWTRTVSRAKSMFMAAGLDSFSVVHKEERPANVVAAVDSLLREKSLRG